MTATKPLNQWEVRQSILVIALVHCANEGVWVDRDGEGFRLRSVLRDWCKKYGRSEENAKSFEDKRINDARNLLSFASKDEIEECFRLEFTSPANLKAIALFSYPPVGDDPADSSAIGHMRDAFGYFSLVARALLEKNAAKSATENAPEKLHDVYVIGAGRHGFKIGFSVRADARLQQLQTGSPYKLTLEHVIKTTEPAACESWLHSLFAERRGVGEWFNLTAGDLAIIKAIGRWEPKSP